MNAKTFSGRYLAIAIPANIAQLVIFKYYYPSATTQDALSWPGGYAVFLRVFNTFIHSDNGLVVFQYLFLHACGWYFLSALHRLFQPRQWISWLLLIGTVFNPFFLLLANLVGSDALFIGLNFCWLAILLEMIGDPSMIKNPSWRLFLFHTAVLGSIVTLRQNAFYYPVISGLAIFLSVCSRRRKALFLLIPVLLLIAGFGIFTPSVGVFTPSGGWQMANNALYAYASVPRNIRTQPPARYAALDSLVRRHFDSTKITRTLFDLSLPGTYYLRDNHSPLVQYALTAQHNENLADYSAAWTKLAPLYNDYGIWLIKEYPAAFATQFCWPNMQRYAQPPLELKREETSILASYQFLHLLVNLFFALILLLFFTAKGVRKTFPVFSKQLALVAVCWLSNMLFLIFTTPVVFRYEIFMMCCCLAFSLLAADKLIAGDRIRLAWPAAKTNALITDCCAYLLVFLFVYAATAKLFRFNLFLFQLENYPLIRHMPILVGWAVPLTELSLAALLLYGRKRLIGLYGSLALMLLFTIYLVVMLRTEEHLPCSCGGVIETLTWHQHVWFNCCFIAISAMGVYFFHHHKNQVYET